MHQCELKYKSVNSATLKDNHSDIMCNKDANSIT